MNVEECLKEVAYIIKTFLLSHGGYDNGYYTSVDGMVLADKSGTLKWSTPQANEELTDKGKMARGDQLYKSIQESMKANKVDKLLIRSRDVEHGAMETVVVYVTETAKRVYLY